MKPILIISFSLICVLATSCISINIQTWGLKSNYKNSLKKYPDLFCPEGTDLADSHSGCEIKLARGKDLHALIQPAARSVVYIWAPECPGVSCLNPLVLQKKCDSMHISLYTVAEYYDVEKFNLSFDKDHPVMAIDAPYYKSDFKETYLRKFLFDLTGQDIKDVARGRYFIFENGKFVKEVLYISDAGQGNVK